MADDTSPLITGKDQLVAFHASGARTPDQWRIGTEHEKFGFRLDDLRPLPYDGERGIEALLQGPDPLRLGAGARNTATSSRCCATAPRSRWSRAASSNSPARRWRPCTRPAARPTRI